jgi:hypothetical protein
MPYKTKTKADGELEPVVSINLPLPQALHRKLKMAAASEGLTVRQAVVLAVEFWVTNG